MSYGGPETVLEAVKHDGFGAVEFDMGAQDFDDVRHRFQTVIDDAAGPGGQKIIDALTFQLEDRPDDGDYYLHKRVPGDTHPMHTDRAPGTEHKYTLHYGPLSVAYARRVFGRAVPRSLGLLFASCGEIHEHTKQAVRPIYEKLGIAGVMLAENPADDVHIVRLLKYLHTDEAKLKAALHFDRSVATVAVSESKEGLIGAKGQNRNVTAQELDEAASNAYNNPLVHYENEAKFFFGAGYNNLPRKFRNPNLPLLLHGVNNLEPDQERDAVVVFMNPRRGFTHIVPGQEQTGFVEVRAHILRHMPPYSDD